MDRVAKFIAGKFNVSRAVINKRAIKEKLWTEDDVVKA
jgi:hypothetical protein